MIVDLVKYLQLSFDFFDFIRKLIIQMLCAFSICFLKPFLIFFYFIRDLKIEFLLDCSDAEDKGHLGCKLFKAIQLGNMEMGIKMPDKMQFVIPVII